MTRQEIREKASEFVSTRASGMPKEMDYYANILTEFATEVTKELEKENAELKNKLEHRNCLDCSNHSSNLRMRNLELEKENAELKDDNKVMADNYSKMEQKFYDNLTKAKEIIKKLMEFAEMDNREYEEEYKEAEQFLNSEVEK